MVIEENQDVFGGAVNLCARVVGLANPGQILTTRQAVEALSPFQKSTCRKLHSTSVKGKTEKISVFEVIWKQDQGLTVVGSGPPTLDPPRLHSLKLSHQGPAWVLNEDRQTLSIGREPDNDLTVAAVKVSRHHAKIFLRGGKFILFDKSANGTYLLDEQRPEMLLRREELVLSGRGRIGLGQSVAECGEETISYESTTDTVLFVKAH